MKKATSQEFKDQKFHVTQAMADTVAASVKLFTDELADGIRVEDGGLSINGVIKECVELADIKGAQLTPAKEIDVDMVKALFKLNFRDIRSMADDPVMLIHEVLEGRYASHCVCVNSTEFLQLLGLPYENDVQCAIRRIISGVHLVGISQANEAKTTFVGWCGIASFVSYQYCEDEQDILVFTSPYLNRLVERIVRTCIEIQ